MKVRRRRRVDWGPGRNEQLDLRVGPGKAVLHTPASEVERVEVQ